MLRIRARGSHDSFGSQGVHLALGIAQLGENLACMLAERWRVRSNWQALAVQGERQQRNGRLDHASGLSGVRWDRDRREAAGCVQVRVVEQFMRTGDRCIGQAVRFEAISDLCRCKSRQSRANGPRQPLIAGQWSSEASRSALSHTCIEPAATADYARR